MTNPFTRWYLHSNRTAQPARFAAGFIQLFDPPYDARSANHQVDEFRGPVAIEQTLAKYAEGRHESR